MIVSEGKKVIPDNKSHFMKRRYFKGIKDNGHIIISCLLKSTDGIFIIEMNTRFISVPRTVFHSFLDWQTAKPPRVKRDGEKRREIKGGRLSNFNGLSVSI